MKFNQFAICLLLMVPAVQANAAGSGGTFPHDSVSIDLNNNASLQRGAHLFVNYCMGCHSLQYQRYSRLAADIGITTQSLVDNLIFDPNTRPGDMMTTSMSSEDGKNWFGAAPPDLTVISRSRGVDYLYNYLRGFHLDSSTPLGVGNSVKTVSMPHALWELEGWKKAVYEEETDSEGNVSKHIVGFETVTSGTMTPSEYDTAMKDLVSFLSYVGEPIQLERKRIGVWVIFFLLLAAVLFYLLKKEYWRDVH